MSQDVLITVEHVSKKYCRSMRRSMLHGMQDIIHDVFGLDGYNEQLRKEEFWAVDDVSFEVKRGECLGIIGPNGAGKSTLLKMLNGIFPPDKGKITIRGRVGGLIELGAGFHPMLTGRENIYINGAILGLSKTEIDLKFDEIVSFAETEKFIDSPVKFYSSGMYVRLGFAIAAHMEPDILLIDEVLAVGDTGFRGKCYNLLAKKLPHTAVCLVSHSMPQTARLCRRGVWLNNGEIKATGAISDVISEYTARVNLSPSVAVDTGFVKFEELKFFDSDQKPADEIHYGKPASLRMLMSVDQRCSAYHIYVSFFTQGDEYAAELSTMQHSSPILATGHIQQILLAVDKVQLSPGSYSVSILVVDAFNTMEHLYWKHHGWKIKIAGAFVSGAPVQIPFSVFVTDGDNHTHEAVQEIS
jgi:lipopolysaccharide transport system ATP-binding protein